MSENIATAVAALQRQMAELMSRTQEERICGMEGEKPLSVPTYRVAEEKPPILPDNDPKRASTRPTVSAGQRAKMCMPDKFDGTKGPDAENYCNQVSLYILTHDDQFTTERIKVMFALSYLTGYASIWAQPFTEKVLNRHDVTFAEFIRQFQAMFFDTERKNRAKRAILELRQTGSITQYTQEFHQLARETRWDKGVLIDLYRQGLRREIRLTLLMGQAEYRTLEDLSAKALRIGSEYEEEVQETPRRLATELQEYSDGAKTRSCRADLSKNGDARD